MRKTQQVTATTARLPGVEYPSEYVIRIFRGIYPRLNLNKKEFKKKKICDVSCGGGRDLLFLKECGFNVYGTEIDQEMVENICRNIADPSITSHIKVGTNDAIPFRDGFFDYLLSWNACYYFGEKKDFGLHVDEFARVLKPGGTLVLSIPKKTAFIFKKSDPWKPGYRIIRNDPFKLRNGAVLRMFQDEKEIQRAFAPHFENFVFGSVQDDCFGFNYHWHLLVCRRK